MPEYTFECKKCGQLSSLICSISEYDDMSSKFKCTHCKSKMVFRSYADDGIHASIKEIKTVAQLAEANEKKYGKELVAKMREEHKTKRKEGMKELPKGMSRVKSSNELKDNYTKSDWKKKGKLK